MRRVRVELTRALWPTVLQTAPGPYGTTCANYSQITKKILAKKNKTYNINTILIQLIEYLIKIINNKLMNDNFSIPEIKNDSPLEFSDIVLRTMQTDIESILKSGGNTTEIYKSAIPININQNIKKKEEEIINKQFPIIKNNYQTIQEKNFNQLNQKEIQEKQVIEEKYSKKLPLLIKIILNLSMLAAFFLIGYFILPKIIPTKVSQEIKPEIKPIEQNNQILQENQTTTVPINDSNQENSQQSNLLSLFKISSDNIVEFNIDTKIPNFKKYYQFLITDSLSKTTSTNQTSTLKIINLKDQNNNLLNWTEFLEVTKTTLLNHDFWNNNFNPNFVGFIYQNKNGIWPGYILEIKNSILPLSIQLELKNLYDNRNILSNFYFNNPDFSKTELQNSLILNKEPVTILKAQTGEKFVYGIFLNKYLILSTSIEGLEQIIRLML